jgi:acyl-CoA thioesterase
MKLSLASARAIKAELPSIPFLKFLGNKIDRLGSGLAQVSIKCRKQLTQTYGFIHGGVLASLADTAAAFATRTLIDPDDKLVTLELKINYLNPAQSDIKALAKVIHQGRRTVVTDVEIKDKENKLCAKALVTYMVMVKGKYP